jgi:hypothetical protein
MKYRSSTWCLCGALLLAGCAEEVPPPTVDEFLADKILLDATIVRCTQNRSQMKYQPECVNAREAANILARDQEAERRKQLEAQSERKRAALRRAQEAADQARRRAADAERRRREAEYLSLFEGGGTGTPTEGAAPPQPGANGSAPPAPADAGPETPEPEQATVPASDGDLQSIREELRRRREGQ